jgi:hypothetical protein
VAYQVRFYNGEILRGASLDDARRCIEAARKMDGAEARFPASIWDEPDVAVARFEVDTVRSSGGIARVEYDRGRPIEHHYL